MENVSNLDLLSEDNIQIIRQRQFDLDEDDDSRDEEINEMTKEDITACLIGWEIGSDSWLDFFISTVSEVTGKDEDEIKSALFDDHEEE